MQKNLSYPLISVIIPAYNAEATIAQTLHSVLAQTYQNIEVIVVDDGSRDRTATIVEQIAQTDNRIILIKQVNAGVAAARNLAIGKSSGKYIAPVDADDIWFPQKLEKQLEVMLQGDYSVGLVYTWSVYLDQDGLLLQKCQTSLLEGDVYLPLTRSNFLGNASTPLFTRACIERVGGYDCQMREQNAQGCEDWDLYLRIAEHYQFRVVPQLLTGYRQARDTMSTNCEAMERSHYLLIKKVLQKHAQYSDKIYRWSYSNFCCYLARKSFQIGAYSTTIYYLIQAACNDFLPFLRRSFYILLIISLLKIIANPITSLVWPDHMSWLLFKSRFEMYLKKILPVPNLSKLHRKHIRNSQRFPWKQYNDFLVYRCLHIQSHYKRDQALEAKH